MDKLNYYSAILKKILNEYYELLSNAPKEGVEDCLAFDEVRDRYFWFCVG